MPHENFLKKKYDLHNAPEVEHTVKRVQKQTKEKISQDPEAKIQAYLNRLEKLVIDPQKEQKRKMFKDEPRPRALFLLREMLMDKYVRPNKEKMAEGAARVEERAARELGIDAHYEEQELAQRGEIAVEDLEKSLDNWISYLSDANEPYPVWFRYYAFRNILDMGDYDKDKGEFTKRSPGSVRLFPDIDRGALAYVEQMIEAVSDKEMLERLRKAQESMGTPEDQLITKQKAEDFSKLSFAKQYVEAIKQAGEITAEAKESTSGKWIKYQKGTDPTALWASLQNKGVSWCTKGFGTAETQLKGGDFYVYYTHDKQGKPTIPRIAIRMQGDSIGEVRGAADNAQNLEANMINIANEKMETLPGADKYRKSSADMKMLTTIDKKTKQNQKLTKNELIFLYEINDTIQGFGYQTDPRIAEIRKTRDQKHDALIVFECEPSQVAYKQEEINGNTKAYIGPLFKGIFQLPIEHICTSFPEGIIRKMETTIGGKDKKQLFKELKENNINISDYAKQMMNDKDFVTSKKPEQIPLVKLTVGGLGLKDGATTDEIYQRAEELGLELCSAETGPNLRLSYKNQPLNDWFRIAMKQITGRVGDPRVFYLECRDSGLWLLARWVEPDPRWDSHYKFAFRLRKLKT